MPFHVLAESETKRLLNKCVDLWNAGGLTYTLIGERLGIGRNSVARLISTARKRGMTVRDGESAQFAQRQGQAQFYEKRRNARAMP